MAVVIDHIKLTNPRFLCLKPMGMEGLLPLLAMLNGQLNASCLS